MSYINKVFAFPGKKRCRFLHDEVQRALVWFYDIDVERGYPFALTRPQFCELLATSKAIEIPDPWISQMLNEAHLTDAERSRIEKLWGAIQPLLFQMPEILIKRYRGKYIAEVVKNGGLTSPTVLGALRLCWQKGLIKAALRPNYRACGAPGKRRISLIKLGRPRSDGTVGVNASAWLDLMAKYWKKSYLNMGKATLRGAYERFKDEAVKKQSGGSADFGAYEERYNKLVLPTLGEFIYQFNVHFSSVQVLLAKKGWRHFNSNVRPILKSARGEVRGIGFRYVIDATVADVHIVSRLDRNRVVGRPTVYFITDVATRMIVGFYVGLEPPSYQAAMLALLNVFEDKVALCARYGIPIPADMWPNAPTCYALLSDGGELIAKAADGLVGIIFQDLETAASFRGDAKAVVERLFGIIQFSFGPYIPGYVVKRTTNRGERDPRLDAAYTLDAFRRAIILAIIRANNTPRRDFDGPPEFIEAGTPYIPARLWEAYQEQHLVDAPCLNYDFVARAIRPKKTVKLVRRGVKFSEGVYYYSKDLLAQDWFLPLLQAGGELELAYDSSDMTKVEVWSPLDPTQTFICELTDHSKRFSGYSLSEINALRKRERTNVKEHWQDGKGHNPEAVEAFIAGRQEDLKREQIAARKAEYDASLSNARRTSNIRENRHAEMRLDQKDRKREPIEGEVVREGADSQPELSDDDLYEASLLDQLSISIKKRNTHVD